MFFDNPIHGDLLPEQTLCLTFDDGPNATPSENRGAETLKLANFLASCAVPATFFVIGSRARNASAVLLALKSLGHLVANHTERHSNLVATVRASRNPVDDVLPTDELLRNVLSYPFTLFRPPFGAWREPGGSSSVARALREESRLGRCIGPIMWDINADDWRCWAGVVSLQECALRYLAAIERRRKGIVLLHDSSSETFLRNGNRCVELANLLIPELLRRGYRFVRLDDVPQVASAVAVSRTIALHTPTGRWLSVARDGAISVDGNEPDGTEFGIVDFGRERIALRGPRGRFVSAEGGGGRRVSCTAEKIDASTIFTVVSRDGARIVLRAPDDAHFLSVAEGEMRADVASVDDALSLEMIPR